MAKARTISATNMDTILAQRNEIDMYKSKVT